MQRLVYIKGIKQDGGTGFAVSHSSDISTRHLPDSAGVMGCEWYQYQSVSKQYQRLEMEEKDGKAELSVLG